MRDPKIVKELKRAILAAEAPGFAAGSLDAIDWMSLLKTITKENWPAIKAALDAFMVTQRPGVRVVWAVLSRAIELWINSLAAAK